jgi:hypothetical protein
MNILDCFSADLSLDEFSYTCTTPVTKISTFEIYPFDILLRLILMSNIDSVTHMISVRYIMDKFGGLWFALDGPASTTVPKHSQMMGAYKITTCIAVGTMSFSLNLHPDESYIILEQINNVSEEFHPTINSLKWVLAALFANIKLKDDSNISLSDHIAITTHEHPVCTLDTRLLDEWIKRNFSDIHLSLLQMQPLKRKTYIYNPLAMKFFLEHPVVAHPIDKPIDKPVDITSIDVVMDIDIYGDKHVI